ncbi:MAG: hypothetical protein A3C53_00380 [Omnitrophica WOR_2 bacterium RIFCSPHIGHO2_02_FULL_68_15]|nr:MAG: hypothetical protein A3C53_00380 [Omnitrophica WOR_2 bacterium RIFCSPHIGHO2_02_FULL_68_15]
MSAQRPTYVLGINDGVVATACLLADGRVVACVSEERLTRQKNQAGLPTRAIAWCLEAAGISSEALALVALSTATMPPFFYEESPSPQQRQFHTMAAMDRWLINRHHPWATSVERALYDWLAPRAGRRFLIQRHRILAQLLKIPVERIAAFDHHTAHGAAALWASPFPSRKQSVLVLTADGEGDLASATVSRYGEGRWERVATTHLADSLGHFYSAVTEHLGMRPHDHEYKVMGLAPYASAAAREEAAQRLRRLLQLREDLTFHAAIHMRACRSYLRRALKDLRFDAVAAAAQVITESLLTSWCAQAMERTGLETVVAGGGVFMNVKANMQLAALPGLRELFVMPSPGDESTAFGAACLGYQRIRPGASIEPIRDLFWGPSVEAADIRQALEGRHQPHWKVTEPPLMAAAVAAVLAQGSAVARVAGRMEWGARALGHRSILADAARPGVVDEINRAIKQRDFWMPFAPAILDTAMPEYVRSPDPAKVNAQYMMVAFEGTDRARRDLRGGMHAYDNTLRAQCVTSQWDPDYYDTVRRFGHLTGRFGLVNTSYNIHGEPMVCTANDALSTFERSGLRYLALGPYLVEKMAIPR